MAIRHIMVVAEGKTVFFPRIRPQRLRHISLSPSMTADAKRVKGEHKPHRLTASSAAASAFFLAIQLTRGRKAGFRAVMNVHAARFGGAAHVDRANRLALS